MQNPPRPKFTFPISSTPEPIPNRSEVTAMMEAFFDVLERHQADPNEGILALLTSFVHGASRILELSSADDAEHNRASLLEMVDRARQAIDGWSVEAGPDGRVH
jgi:hypothetical protein